MPFNAPERPGNEHGYIAEVCDKLAERVALVPWMSEPLTGATGSAHLSRDGKARARSRQIGSTAESEEVGVRMLQLNGYLHRERLSKILGRSLSSSFEGPDAVREDSRALKHIVNFNAYCGCLILDAFSRSLLTSLHGEPVRSYVVQSKGALKDVIVSGVPHRSPRLQDLIARYQRHPEDYYRETPVNGRIYHQQDRFLGAARVKRFRRIAEKASRYLIDFLFREVKSGANELAQERARRLGVAKSMLHTPIEEQIAEFAHAERRVLKLIKGGQLLETLPVLPLNDILGFKVLCEGREVAEVTDRLADLKECSIEEQEAHSGGYNATHLIVRYRWPRDTVLSHAPAGRAREILLERGCACDIPEAFTAFVSTAEDNVVVEVIVCSWDEMLESEIGRSMHEERILAQRSHQQYQGSVAKNIEWLMEYLFRFCLSPLSSLDELPIRLWVRHMPDYIDLLHGRLAGTSAEADFTQACVCGEGEPWASRGDEGQEFFCAKVANVAKPPHGEKRG